MKKDDLISRQVAIDAMSAVNDSICEQQAIDALWELPSAQPERKKGRWIITDTDSCYCSECKKDPISFVNGSEFWWLDKMPNFCPNCGADMRGEKDG